MLNRRKLKCERSSSTCHAYCVHCCFNLLLFFIFTEKIEGLEGGSRFCLSQEETSQALNYKSPFFFGVLSIKCIEGCYLLQNNLVL